MQSIVNVQSLHLMARVVVAGMLITLTQAVSAQSGYAQPAEPASGDPAEEATPGEPAQPEEPAGEPAEQAGPADPAEPAETAEPEEKTDEKAFEIPPPPEGFDSKQPLSLSDLKRKKEGGYPTGLPLANFDPNSGFGGGIRGYYYINGDRDDALFAYTPYLHRFFLQFFFTSKGLQFHWFDYDAPSLFGTPYRLRSQAIFMRNTEQHFYGIGNDSIEPLTFTGAGRTFDKYSDYTDGLRTVRPDGTALSRYNDYDLIRPFWIISLERTFLKGLVRPLVGLGVTYADITDYTGQDVTADGAEGDVEVPMGPTLLSEQCAAGMVVGCDGGWNNFLRFGISFDTRDFEPDPNRGIFLDMSLDLGTKLVGSEYNYARFLTAARGYISPFPDFIDLVFAARGTFEAQSKGTPFFSLPTMPWTDDPKSGLGGLRTLRGYRQDRFIGRYITLLNMEMRLTYFRFEVLRQKFALGAVAFLDTGRVYDTFDDLTFKGWRRGQGLGFRVAWNQATIVAVDLGFSDEDVGLYINFNHQF